MTPTEGFNNWWKVEVNASNPPRDVSGQSIWLAACAWQREKDASSLEDGMFLVAGDDPMTEAIRKAINALATVMRWGKE